MSAGSPNPLEQMPCDHELLPNGIAVVTHSAGESLSVQFDMNDGRLHMDISAFDENGDLIANTRRTAEEWVHLLKDHG